MSGLEVERDGNGCFPVVPNGFSRQGLDDTAGQGRLVFVVNNDALRQRHTLNRPAMTQADEAGSPALPPSAGVRLPPSQPPSPY
jgi:hypothetical protein